MTDSPLFPPPDETPKPKRRWFWPLMAAAALVVGIGVGAASADPSSMDAEPREPAPTATETVTETVEVEVVPQACLDALDDADELNVIAADFADVTAVALELAAQGFEATANLDIVELERINAEAAEIPDQMDALSARVQSSSYADNRDACKAAE